MKEFIKHCINENIQHVLEHSYFNCHVEGLHSIMLCKNKQSTIRMYVAEKDSKLHDKDFMLSIHPHHCNLTLHVIKGILVNEIYEQTQEVGKTYKKYKYTSGILNDKAWFNFIENVKLSCTSRNVLNVDSSVNIKAKQLHSVFCPEKVKTVWMVYQGEEDNGYEPFCYNTENPNRHITDNLYQRMSIKELFKVLEDV